MIAFEPIFIDTTPLIYLVENHPKYYDRVFNFISTEITEKENRFVTSVLTVTEFQVVPKRNNDLLLIEDFNDALIKLDVQIFDINVQTAETASTLRAKYRFLKTLDALQVACALKFGCRRFLTNDIKLKSLTELDILLVDNL